MVQSCPVLELCLKYDLGDLRVEINALYPL